MVYAILVVSVSLFTKQTEDAFSSSVNSIVIDLNILMHQSFETPAPMGPRIAGT